MHVLFQVKFDKAPEASIVFPDFEASPFLNLLVHLELGGFKQITKYGTPANHSSGDAPRNSMFGIRARLSR
jgi:hypothetical protein